MSDGRVLVYGSYGYTGDLVVRRAVMRKLDPVVAGRRGAKVNPQADDLGLEARVFGLDDPESVARELRGIDVVLNCAGPFADTYEPMVEACLRTGTDYLDVTGEIDVFESIAGYDEAARSAGVTLLPGVGFDVVPTDCLAVHLVERLPGATDLELALDWSSGVSPGTAKTALRNLDGALVREDGAIRRRPFGTLNRRVDFGDGPRPTTAIPWGDVSTASHSTGVENVRVYATVPRPGIWAMRATGWLAPLLRTPPVQAALRGTIERTVSGPSDRRRREGRVRLWGRASTGDEAVAARMETPEPYEFTVRSSLAVVERVLDGEASPGYWTPAGAFGPDLALSVADVRRETVDP